MGHITGVECDHCSEDIIFNRNFPKTHIEKWIRKKGWTVGKTIKCPSCAKNRKSKGE